MSFGGLDAESLDPDSGGADLVQLCTGKVQIKRGLGDNGDEMRKSGRMGTTEIRWWNCCNKRLNLKI